MTPLPRRFALQRDHDVTGVSGTGIVADGICWPDGTAAVRWRGDRPSTVHWDHGMDSVETIHGHGGHTRIRWLDSDPGTDEIAVVPLPAEDPAWSGLYGVHPDGGAYAWHDKAGVHSGRELNAGTADQAQDYAAALLAASLAYLIDHPRTEGPTHA
ncbi:hypothetical protein [Streptomonospora litoralis]|uniref:Uncharacterized protein n=1 Tax=Streptomonospora litoralis TaxID=2498135 RepID=A0A4V0ZJH1_9ACTN|nr:hypothetical protein [Streptomonospora litoralis]QBI53462.1 hypothetical protein EKD16_08340 [Streptomonospora litoralis]